MEPVAGRAGPSVGVAFPLLVAFPLPLRSAGPTVACSPCSVCPLLSLASAADSLRPAGPTPDSTEERSHKAAHVVATVYAFPSSGLRSPGKLIGLVALARTESRGNHFREDSPQTDEAWLRHLVVRRGERGPVVAVRDGVAV